MEWAFLFQLAGSIILFVALLVSVEHESAFASFAVTVVALIFFWFLYDNGPFRWVSENPIRFIGVLALYFVIGSMWSVFKWYLYVRKNREFVHQRYTSSVRKGSFDDYLNSAENPMHIMNNKERITIWMIWWVPSMIWTAIHDMVKGIWNFIYNMLGTLYTNIMKAVVGQPKGPDF